MAIYCHGCKSLFAELEEAEATIFMLKKVVREGLKMENKRLIVAYIEPFLQREGSDLGRRLLNYIGEGEKE